MKKITPLYAIRNSKGEYLHRLKMGSLSTHFWKHNTIGARLFSRMSDATQCLEHIVWQGKAVKGDCDIMYMGEEVIETKLLPYPQFVNKK